MENNNKGALWNKKSNKGMDYKGGNITIDGKTYQIAVFHNDKRGNEKAPDYKIIVNEPKELDELGLPKLKKEEEISVETLPF